MTFPLIPGADHADPHPLVGTNNRRTCCAKQGRSRRAGSAPRAFVGFFLVANNGISMPPAFIFGGALGPDRRVGYESFRLDDALPFGLPPGSLTLVAAGINSAGAIVISDPATLSW